MPARDPRPPAPVPLVVVIDGGDAGLWLASLLADREIGAVHLATTPALAPHVPEAYIATAGVEDPTPVLRILARRDVRAVIAGSESGVDLAAELAARFHVPHHVPRLARARRDKAEMHARVAAAGRPVPRQALVRSAAQAVAWMRGEGLTRCIAKPVDSAGADGVTACPDEDALRTAVNALLGRRHRVGRRSGVVLVMEHLVGDELVVDAVSCRGAHRFLSVWQTHRRPLNGGSFAHDRRDLLTRDDPRAVAAVAYTRGVLDALGIREGPSHTELMTTDEGCLLLECGARFDGFADARFEHAALGASAIAWTADAISGPFRSEAAEPRQHASYVTLASGGRGLLAEVPGISLAQGLASYVSWEHGARIGDAIVPTRDYASIPGVACLAHSDPAVITQDVARLRAWEAAGEIYRLVGPDKPPVPVVTPRFAASEAWARLVVAAGGRAVQIDGMWLRCEPHAMSVAAVDLRIEADIDALVRAARAIGATSLVLHPPAEGSFVYLGSRRSWPRWTLHPSWREAVAELLPGATLGLPEPRWTVTPRSMGGRIAAEDRIWAAKADPAIVAMPLPEASDGLLEAVGLSHPAGPGPWRAGVAHWRTALGSDATLGVTMASARVVGSMLLARHDDRLTAVDFVSPPGPRITLLVQETVTVAGIDAATLDLGPVSGPDAPLSPLLRLEPEARVAPPAVTLRL